MSITIVKANYKPKKLYKSKLTADKAFETISMIAMLTLFIVQTAYGDTSAIGKLAKKLITYLILSNLGITTVKSIKSAMKTYQKVVKVNQI